MFQTKFVEKMKTHISNAQKECDGYDEYVIFAVLCYSGPIIDTDVMNTTG